LIESSDDAPLEFRQLRHVGQVGVEGFLDACGFHLRAQSLGLACRALHIPDAEARERRLEPGEEKPILRLVNGRQALAGRAPKKRLDDGQLALRPAHVGLNPELLHHRAVKALGLLEEPRANLLLGLRVDLVVGPLRL